MGPFPVQDPPRQETSNFLSCFFGFVTCHTSRNKMGFGDVKTAAGVKALNDFLADMAHALRWYNQIKSYSAEESKKFPGVKDASKYMSGGAAAAADDDDDVDLFGSDDEGEEESEEAKRVREERLAAYAAKKSKKPAVIAKTSVLLDVKPWDDETDLDAMLTSVKSIEMDGLVWGANKLVPVGYGINKLQVMCVVEDAKVSIDELQEKISDFEDSVQSVDVAAMNKI